MRPASTDPSYVPNLSDHLCGTLDPDQVVSMEEVIAVRWRVTGRWDNDGPWFALVTDWGELGRHLRALAGQGLRRGDLGPAYQQALSRAGGSVSEACEEMLRAFGRAPSRSYVAYLRRLWKAAEVEREARAEEVVEEVRRRLSRNDPPRGPSA